MLKQDHERQKDNGRVLSRATRRQLAAYSAAIAAGGIFAPSRAEAAVIPIQLPGGGPVIIETPAPGHTAINYNLDMNGDGVLDFRLQSYLGTSISSLSTRADLNGAILWYMSSNVRFLSAGELIDNDLTVDRGWDALRTFGLFNSFIGTRGYAGVQFDIPGGSPHFGYLDVAVDQTGNKLTLYGGAYESQTGVGIAAGAVPEPSGLALLAMGAAGLAAWRRKSRDRA